MRSKWIWMTLIIGVLLMMPMTVLAQKLDAESQGSVSITLMDPDGETPISGAEFSLYYVASAERTPDTHWSYTYTDAFKDCGCLLEDPTLSEKLDIYVEEHGVTVEIGVTDTYGKVTFTQVPLGLYFVKQTNNVKGYAPCASFLVMVPHQSTEGYVYDVEASPKTDVARFVDITIRKVWNTDASVQAAEYVTVQLLREGTVVETATLNEQNHWQVTYVDMPESDAYSVEEIHIPKGFTATYSQKGYVFTVTNSASLIQTGQLIWPIPVLAMTGLCLIAMGVPVLRKSRNRNA